MLAFFALLLTDIIKSLVVNMKFYSGLVCIGILSWTVFYWNYYKTVHYFVFNLIFRWEEEQLPEGVKWLHMEHKVFTISNVIIFLSPLSDAFTWNMQI